MKSAGFWCLLWVCAQALADAPVSQASDAMEAELSAARQQLKLQRQAIEQQYEAQQRACWQRFAVNDCLREARRSRHAALDPLRTQDLQLNAQERDWRSRQRDERLRNKQEAVHQP